jgi:hypothetical protein
MHKLINNTSKWIIDCYIGSLKLLTI